jgi:S1-C subfamily serine protease
MESAPDRDYSNPMAGSGSPARWALPLAAGATSLASVFVIGALVTKNAAALARGGALLALGALGAFVVCLALPLIAHRVVIRAVRRKDPTARSHLAIVLVVYGVALVILAFAGLPTMTEIALREHPDWFLPGSQADAETSDPGDSGDSGDSEPDGGADVNAAGSPSEIFAARAGSVVVLRTRSPIPASDPRAASYRALGLAWIASSGSGFITSPSGIVVTNYHVAGEAEAVEILLHDGRTFSPVERLVVDKERDLAVLRIDATGLPAITLAPDDAIQTGMRSIAIGSPLGMEYSVTDGIISAVRDMQGTTFLQMQTTIAPGSSGGPLFDTRGRVIGVNTGTRGAGLNLAVHVKYVRDILARPHQPKRLGAYVQGARIAAMTFEGASVTPIDRLNYEEPLSVFGQGAESCLKSLAPGARIIITYERDGAELDGATVSSPLPRAELGCLSANIQLTSAMIGRLLTEHCRAEIESGVPVTLVVTWEGLRGAKPGAGQTLEVRYVVAKPGEPPPDDDLAQGGTDEGPGGDDDGTEAIEVP